MPDIYDRHRDAFRDVDGYVITDATGDRVATIALKRSRNGMRVYAYAHIIGCEMTRAYAGGGGYDRHSAAVESAVAKMKPNADAHPDSTANAVLARLQPALRSDSGRS